MADEEKKEGEDEAPKKGGGKKLLIFGLIGGLLIGGGATFGALFFLGGDHEGDGAVEEVAEPEPLPELTTVYVTLNRIPASLVDERGKILGYVFMDLSLEVANGDDRDWVATQMPLVRDAVLRSVARNGVAPPGRPAELDYDGATSRMKEALNKALKRDVIVQVLLVSSLQQMN